MIDIRLYIDNDATIIDGTYSICNGVGKPECSSLKQQDTRCEKITMEYSAKQSLIISTSQ